MLSVRIHTQSFIGKGKPLYLGLSTFTYFKPTITIACLTGSYYYHSLVIFCAIAIEHLIAFFSPEDKVPFTAQDLVNKSCCNNENFFHPNLEYQSINVLKDLILFSSPKVYSNTSLKNANVHEVVTGISSVKNVFLKVFFIYESSFSFSSHRLLRRTLILSYLC
jgi:hypothetical protein